MEYTRSKIRHRLGTIWLIIALGMMPSVYASETAPNGLGRLDSAQVQLLRMASAPGEKMTPLRVLRWISSEWTDTPMENRTPVVEFQPIVHKHNSDLQVIATLAYKF